MENYDKSWEKMYSLGAIITIFALIGILAEVIIVINTGDNEATLP